MRKIVDNKRVYDIRENRIGYGDIFFRQFDSIIFSNGYSKNRTQFEIELKGIEIKEGNPEWGVKLGVKYFVLKLGNIL